MGLEEILDENFDSDCVYVTKIVWIVCRWTLFQQLFPVTKTSTVKRTTSLLTVSCNIPNGSLHVNFNLNQGVHFIMMGCKRSVYPSPKVLGRKTKSYHW